MTSAINPNLIDGSYPVAGQDNNSQGFRDNFTNIKNNFTYAYDELTDLQSKVVLKSALSGGSISNDMAYAQLISPQLLKAVETKNDLGTKTGSFTISWADGHFQYYTTSGNTTLAFSNWPASGIAGSVTVEITIDPAYLSTATLTLPTSVSVNNAEIIGAVVTGSGTTIVFPAAGTYSFTFSSYTAGAAITVDETNKLLMPFNNSTEDLANGATIDIGTTASLVATSGAETATLPDGTNGQVKVLSMTGHVGNMVITVTNAGWQSSGTGTITFNDIGDACTLQYINSKWFAIGANGVTFG